MSSKFFVRITKKKLKVIKIMEQRKIFSFFEIYDCLSNEMSATYLSELFRVLIKLKFIRETKIYSHYVPYKNAKRIYAVTENFYLPFENQFFLIPDDNSDRYYNRRG